MKTVLITGIDGFTGTHLSVALRATGFKVVGLSNVVDNARDNVFQCDLLDKVRLQNILTKIQPDYVIHLAAISFVGHGNAEDFYRVNVVGTMSLLEVLSELDKKPSKVLIASSANIYGTPDVVSIDESVQPLPVNHYATSKLAMECMVRTMFNRLPIVITRPFNYTGAGQAEQFLIPKIVSHFKRKEKVIELGNLNISRDFSDVRSVCQTYLKLLEQPAAIGQTFNICSGKVYSLREVLSFMAEIAGYEIEVKVNPDFVRQNEIKRLAGSNKHLHETIGVQQYPTIEETLRWMYESYS